MDTAHKRIEGALGLLDGLAAAPGLAELGRRTRIVVSPLWAGRGGSAVFNRVNLPAWAIKAPAWQLAALLAHELTHVRQGVRFFGSIDTEREAYTVQRSVEIELLGRAGAAGDEIARRQADLGTLRRGGAQARAWISKQGPMYARFPETQPRWWQIGKWWPQVAGAIAMAWRGRRSGGGAD